MVARMMRWPPWPPVRTKKFQVRLVLLRLESSSLSPAVGSPGKTKTMKKAFAAEVRWKGGKTTLASLRGASVQRNHTAPSELRYGDSPSTVESVAEWNEDFRCVCGLVSGKDEAFHPWEIAFSLLESSTESEGVAPGRKKMSVVGSASLNLADFVRAAQGQELRLTLPLTLTPATAAAPAAADTLLSLQITLEAVEMRPARESPATRSVAPAPPSPPPPVSSPPAEISALKAGLRRVKILTDLMSSARWSSKREEGGGKSDNSSGPSAFSDDDEDEETESVRKSFGYGTLAATNFLGSSTGEDCVYFSGTQYQESSSSSSSSSSPSTSYSGRKVGLIPWKKRKLSFRSPRPRGEPLLKRAYAEDGGDDIDHDRRQLSSSDGESSSRRVTPIEGDFGDEDGRFEVGRWEEKEVVSRDGLMKLRTQVFFASMDQRSEEAGGESACAALVAVIADWLLRSADNTLPIKTQFDSLIREGSRQWRRLCDDPIFSRRFPDCHLDLDAVLEGGVRPLTLVPSKSLVGFFQPDDGTDHFSFLTGAMSFDSIWDEVSRMGTTGVYIISWNDHFFVLKAEEEAYYVIDTLGERLHEGCTQAYMLKFDAATSILQLGPAEGEEGEPVVLAKGKECCKDYIRGFLAAIPVRELQVEVSKGLTAAATPLYQRLQIEFHFAQLSSAPSPPPC